MSDDELLFPGDDGFETSESAAPLVSQDDAPPSRKKNSAVGLVIAVVLGGVVAYFGVRMLPDGWRPGGGKKDAAQKSDEPDSDFVGDGAPPLPTDGKSAPQFQEVSKSARTTSFARGGNDKPKQPNPVEATAQRELEQAQKTLKSDKNAGIEALEDVRNRHPGTKAAVRAQELLDML